MHEALFNRGLQGERETTESFRCKGPLEISSAMLYLKHIQLEQVVQIKILLTPGTESTIFPNSLLPIAIHYLMSSMGREGRKK